MVHFHCLMIIMIVLQVICISQFSFTFIGNGLMVLFMRYRILL